MSIILPNFKAVQWLINFFTEEAQRRKDSYDAGEDINDYVPKSKLESYKEYQVRDFTVAEDNLRNLNDSAIDLGRIEDPIYVVQDIDGVNEIFDGIHRKRVVCDYENNIDELHQVVLSYDELVEQKITQADLKAFAYHCNRPPRKPRRSNNKSEHVAFVLDVYVKDDELFEEEARAFLKTCNNSNAAISNIIIDVKNELDIRREEKETGRIWKKYTGREQKELKASYQTKTNLVMTMSSGKFDYGPLYEKVVHNKFSLQPFERVDILVHHPNPKARDIWQTNDVEERRSEKAKLFVLDDMQKTNGLVIKITELPHTVERASINI